VGVVVSEHPGIPLQSLARALSDDGRTGVRLRYLQYHLRGEPDMESVRPWRIRKLLRPVGQAALGLDRLLRQEVEDSLLALSDPPSGR
jgi:hypothetical protein